MDVCILGIRQPFQAAQKSNVIMKKQEEAKEKTLLSLVVWGMLGFPAI